METINIHYSYYRDDGDVDPVLSVHNDMNVNVEGTTWVELLQKYLDFLSNSGFCIPEEKKTAVMLAIEEAAMLYKNEPYVP